MYCYTSARTGEVHESTARRHTARQKKAGSDPDDKALAAETLSACYEVSSAVQTLGYY